MLHLLWYFAQDKQNQPPVAGQLGRAALGRIVYRMIKYGKPYVDAGMEYYEQRYRERVMAGLKRRASEMGFELLPMTKLELAGTGRTVPAIELPPAP